MPQVMLNDARIMAIIGEFEARGMAEHVRMHRESQVRGLARAGDDLPDRGRGQRPLSFTHKHVGRLGLRPRQDPQRPNLWAV